MLFYDLPDTDTHPGGQYVRVYPWDTDVFLGSFAEARLYDGCVVVPVWLGEVLFAIRERVDNRRSTDASLKFWNAHDYVPQPDRALRLARVFLEDRERRESLIELERAMGGVAVLCVVLTLESVVPAGEPPHVHR